MCGSQEGTSEIGISFWVSFRSPEDWAFGPSLISNFLPTREAVGVCFMTTGNLVDDKRVSYQRDYNTNYMSTGVVVIGSGLVGPLYIKNWSGTDRPKVKRLYNRFFS